MDCPVHEQSMACPWTVHACYRSVAQTKQSNRNRHSSLRGGGSDHFDQKQNQIIKNFRIPLLGLHNIKNSVAAIAVALTVGLPISNIQIGLKNFKGIVLICFADTPFITSMTLKNIVKLNIFLTDLSDFQLVNEVMKKNMVEPFPARAAIGVKQLPRDAKIEMDGVMVL